MTSTTGAATEASTSPATTDAATTDAATTDAATTGEPDDTTGGPADDLSPKVYPADDPRIHYTGRIEFGDPASATFSAPRVYVTARFRGVSAAVHLEDQFVWDVNRNFYEVVVDGAAVMKLAPEKGVTRYVVATGLANTTHTITLVKRTESALGWCKFKGFEFEGELDEPPPRPARRMAFIGDSITVGSGNEAANNSLECSADAYGNPGGWGQPYHNNWRSYGAVAARSLGAEYHVTAVSTEARWMVASKGPRATPALIAAVEQHARAAALDRLAEVSRPRREPASEDEWWEFSEAAARIVPGAELSRFGGVRRTLRLRAADPTWIAHMAPLGDWCLG